MPAVGRLAVAHDDEERVVELAAPVQEGDQPADLPVGLAKRPAIGRTGMEDVLGPEHKLRLLGEVILLLDDAFWVRV